jgi:long-chain fatty acid transport protein
MRAACGPAALVALVVSAGVALPSTAFAGGLATARFGGEHGHPTSDHASAIYYNPAGIALSKGTHIVVDGTFAYRNISYERPESAINNPALVDARGIAANSGTATLNNFIAAPMLGVTSDFGTDFIYSGVAVYVPFGGQSVYDQNDDFADDDQYPGAKDGVQRWYAIDGAIRSLYITVPLAFNIRKIGLTLGVSGSAILSTVETIRARNVDGTDDVIDVNGRLKEGRSAIDVSGWQGGFGVGFVQDLGRFWQQPDTFWFGAAYTSQPNVVGGMALEGTLTNVFTTSQPSETKVRLEQTYPDIVRFGLRYRPSQRWEVRLFGDYQRWSVTEDQCLLQTERTDAEGNVEVIPESELTCGFANKDSALDDPENFGAANADTTNVVQYLPRFWQDSGGVRVGASWWPKKTDQRLELYAGLGYDSSAIPVETVDPALFDMDKITISLGARGQIAKWFALSGTLTPVIYFPFDTDGRNVLNTFQSPARQASAEGRYSQFIQVVNIWMDFSF